MWSIIPDVKTTVMKKRLLLNKAASTVDQFYHHLIFSFIVDQSIF